jgi:malonyl CoA-acyl carrier protein transacylase
MHHTVPHQGCCKDLESHLVYSGELEAVAQAVIAACMSAANAAPHTTQTMSSSTLMTCSTCDM